MSQTIFFKKELVEVVQLPHSCWPKSARVLHCLDAAVRQVLVVLEPVGVVLEDPELFSSHRAL